MSTAPLSVVSQAIQARLVLLANHVLSAEPVAMQKLQPHAGQSIELHFASPDTGSWKHWLPKPTPVTLTISRAGLLEVGSAVAPLALTVTLSAPTLVEAWDMLRQRQRPPMKIEGDSHLAEAVSWVTQNVRWDVTHDVHQLVGTPLAAGLGTLRDRAEQTLSRWRQGRHQ